MLIHAIKMADHFDIKLPECKNYITTARWLVYTGHCLKKYSTDKLQCLHQDIYKKLAHLPPCVNLCSRRHGRLCHQWCRTCQDWKDELLQARRQPDVRWEKTKSWLWPSHYNNIAEVFYWTMRSPTFNDVSYLCSLWDNCRGKFRINRTVIKRVRDERNTLKHNSQMRVSNDDKDKLFDVIEDLLHDPDIQPHVNTNDCIRHLRVVEAESYRDEEVRGMIRQLQIDLGQLLDIQEDHSMRLEHLYTNVKILLFLFVFVCICSTVCNWLANSDLPQNHLDDRTRQNELSKCLPNENYRYPFIQDFPQCGYISDHREIFGRKWVFETLEPYVLHTSTNSSGVVLAADIGYGKSAIVSHLICGQKSEKGRSIRKHIVAFHVCRFDVESTKKGERFIRRLTGFFSSKSAEYGSILAHLSNESIVHDREKCEKELEACFDQGIVFPLNQIDTPINVPWLVVIDALDECSDIKLKENTMIRILARGLRKIPSWVKFIITSRKTGDLSKLKALYILYFDATDLRNIQDIHLFIQSKVNDTFHNSNIVKTCRGNFQFARHFINHMTTFGYYKEFTTFPQTLNEIYEADFERVFPIEKSFESSRHILEVLCTTISPLTKSEILKILSHRNQTIDILTTELEKLSYYVKTSIDEQFVFVHQSISEWLLSGNSARFAISSENGHQTISSSMLKSFNCSQVVDLAIHVAAAENSSLNTMFQNVVKQCKLEPNVLHKLVWRTGAVEALKLIMTVYKDVDSLNNAYITPAFVAASNGHLGQLQMLYTFGADLNFIKGNNNDIFHHFESIEEIISLHSDVYYTGYNLLQVATKHGHLPVVDYLLTKNKSSLHMMNAVGYRASDIACEKGHLSILKRFVLSNKTVVDKNCFYLATKNNRIDILNYLIEININIDCMSDKNSIYCLSDKESELKYLKIGAVKFLVYHNRQTKSHVNLGVCETILKETPLHVALKLGHYETFSMMVAHFPNLLDCTDSFGYTPVLKSIVYNTTDVQNPLIRQRLLTDKCGTSNISVSSLSLTSKPLLENPCPVGAMSVHLIALYGRVDIALSLISQNTVIDWDTPDDSSLAPVHYASMKGQIQMLEVLSHLNVDVFNTRTRDGLTAFHIICKAGDYTSFYILTNTLKFNVSMHKDKENRSVLHHTVLPEFIRIAEIDEELQNRQYLMFKHIVESKRYSLFEVDIYNRNVLHYVIRNGHVPILTFLLKYYPDEVWQLMSEYDRFNQTPTAFAFEREKEVKFTIPSECVFTDIFLVDCNIKVSRYLLSWEYAMLILIENASPQQSITFLVPQLSRILNRSPYLTTALIIHNKHIDAAIIKQHIHKGLVTGINAFSLLSIARHRPYALVECGKSLYDSPLHLIALKYPIVLQQIDVRTLFHFLFGNHVDRKLLSCTDQSGYNILHYAVKANNLFLADSLLDLHIDVSTSKVSIIRFAWMILLKTPKNNASNESMLIKANFGISGDDILVKLLQRPNLILPRKDICSNMSRELSVIHILAANGFKKTIEAIGNMYGNIILSCLNSDGFTPLYLAKLFNHTNVITYLEERTSLSLPSTLAEAHLVYNLDNHFALSSQTSNLPFFRVPNMPFKDWIHNEVKFSSSQAYPFLCLRQKLNFRKDIQYKRWRMLKCIKNVITFCKSLPIKDPLVSTMLQNASITTVYTSTRFYFILQSIVKEASTDEYSLESTHRLLNFLDRSNDANGIETLIVAKKLRMIHINKRGSLLILLSSIYHFESRDDMSMIPCLERFAGMYLEALYDATLQISIRVLNSMFGKARYPNAAVFFGQRLTKLDLLLPDHTEPTMYKYTQQMYRISRTLNRYQYLDVIRMSHGYMKYRDWRMNHLKISESIDISNELNEFMSYSNSLVKSLENIQHGYGKKTNLSSDLDSGNV